MWMRLKISAEDAEESKEAAVEDAEEAAVEDWGRSVVEDAEESKKMLLWCHDEDNDDEDNAEA